MSQSNKTIAALATQSGRSALAVIRVSGPRAFQVIRKLLTSEDADRLEHRKATLVSLFAFAEQGEKRFLDECIIVPYTAPQTYTGEDMVEIFTHGGRLVPALVLQALLDAGAVLAEPGEFTERAFLNGKIDLAKAEAIDSLSRADTASELSLIHQHYSGQFSEEVRRIRAEITDLLSLLELELDFSEEDVEFADRDELRSRLEYLSDFLGKLSHSYERAHLIREGIRVAIIGKPNTGKSSLLNLLVKKERAIVTDVPGTTRDIIEEAVEIRGQKYLFIDTAGIREADDIVEAEGIRRSRSALESADIVVIMLDSSRRLERGDWEIRQHFFSARKEAGHGIFIVLNKSDCAFQINEEELHSFCGEIPTVRLSCLNGTGLDQFEEHLLQAGEGLLPQSDDNVMVLNIRQKHAVEKALQAVERARYHFSEGYSQEFIATDIRLATDALSELIGEITTEDILGNIFANFCIGK